MMNQATLDFVNQHQDEDVRQLAFLGSKYPGVDMPFALDQIRGRKMARAKLPRWAGIDGIIYPPHISMEQCSSETTALYKAELAARLLNLQKSENCEFATKDAVDSKFAKNGATCKFVDLTGGFGVDFSYIVARLGVRSMYVERQAHLCEVAKENFERLELRNAIIRNEDGVEVLHSLDKLKLIFIDPARRDGAGNKVVSLQDCTPNVTLLQDEMLEKADFVIIKLSPMLDWHRAVSELKYVREVHIISVNNECKELLLVLSARKKAEKETGDTSEDYTGGLRVYCVNDAQQFVFEEPNEYIVSIAKPGDALTYLYEPNASLMKAGCFGSISEHYAVKMLAKNSHLFVSDRKVGETSNEGNVKYGDFPGRAFRIKAISSLNKKELKRHLAGLAKANIATRNFPLSVEELRKRLKLKDGGEVYIFATTLSDDSHVLLFCEKIGGQL